MRRCFTDKSGKSQRLQSAESRLTSNILTFGSIKRNGFSLSLVGVVYKQHRRDSVRRLLH